MMLSVKIWTQSKTKINEQYVANLRLVRMVSSYNKLNGIGSFKLYHWNDSFCLKTSQESPFFINENDTIDAIEYVNQRWILF